MDGSLPPPPDIQVTESSKRRFRKTFLGNSSLFREEEGASRKFCALGTTPPLSSLDPMGEMRCGERRRGLESVPWGRKRGGRSNKDNNKGSNKVEESGEEEEEEEEEEEAPSFKSPT